MKKFLALTIALLMVLSLAACGSSADKTSAELSVEPSAAPVALTVFAAASMTETLD